MLWSKYGFFLRGFLFIHKEIQVITGYQGTEIVWDASTLGGAKVYLDVASDKNSDTPYWMVPLLLLQIKESQSKISLMSSPQCMILFAKTCTSFQVYSLI